jgi:hypothetical protein
LPVAVMENIPRAARAATVKAGAASRSTVIVEFV